METVENKVEPGVETPSQIQNQQADSGEKDSATVQKSNKGAWISQLPKYLRGNFNAEEIPTQTDLAIAYLNLKEKTNAAQTEGASGEQAHTYTESDYEEVGKLFDGEDAQGKALLKFFKDNNVAPENIKGFVEGLRPSEEDNRVRIEVARQTVQMDLRNRWGVKYDENQRFYQRAIDTLYDKETQSRISEKGLAMDADFIDLASRYGRVMSEGTPANSSFGNAKRRKEDEYKAWGLM